MLFLLATTSAWENVIELEVYNTDADPNFTAHMFGEVGRSSLEDWEWSV